MGVCRGKWGMTAIRYRVSFWSDENILNLGHSDGCITL